MVRQEEVADFLRQASLLTRANLPLPSGLPELAQSMPEGQFKTVVLAISEEVASGGRFVDALAKHPAYFSGTDIALLASAEKAHSLTDALRFAAENARFNGKIVLSMRAAASYPWVTILLTILVAGLLFGGVCASFRPIFHELNPQAQLPLLTQVILFISELIRDYRYVFIACYLALVALSLLYFLPTVRSQRRLIALLGHIPVGRKLTEQLATAQLCRAWSAFMANGLNDAASLKLIAPGLPNPQVGRAVARVAARLEAGESLSDAVEAEKALPMMLRTTLPLTPAADLPKQLERLAAGELEEAGETLKTFETVWSLALFIFAAVLIGLAIVGTFLPYMNLIRWLL